MAVTVYTTKDVSSIIDKFNSDLIQLSSEKKQLSKGRYLCSTIEIRLIFTEFNPESVLMY